MRHHGLLLLCLSLLAALLAGCDSDIDERFSPLGTWQLDGASFFLVLTEDAFTEYDWRGDEGANAMACYTIRRLEIQSVVGRNYTLLDTSRPGMAPLEVRAVADGDLLTLTTFVPALDASFERLFARISPEPQVFSPACPATRHGE